MRGGVSVVFPVAGQPATSSPRAWGCFPFQAPASPVTMVFPTCVGVFPLPSPVRKSFVSLPHVRGGVSRSYSPIDLQGESSPRAWGCFRRPEGSCGRQGVFPTCVGVFLKKYIPHVKRSGLPHVRGGVSYGDRSLSILVKSSPRAWGCFWIMRLCICREGVFPTCVGVFPLSPLTSFPS